MSMGYPTDHLQRGIFIQTHRGAAWPIDFTANWNSLLSQIPTTQPSISINCGPGNISLTSGGTICGNHHVCTQFNGSDSVETRPFPTHIQEHGGSQVGLPASSIPTRTLPFQNQSWPPSLDEITYQRQHGDQTEFGAIDPSMTISMNLGTPGSLDETQNPGRVPEMAPAVDTNHTQCGAQSGVNAPPLMQCSHDVSASMIYHEQFAHWLHDPCRRSVPTPHSLTVAPLAQSSRITDPRATASQTLLHSSGQHFVHSSTDSGYGGSRPSTHSNASQKQIDFHAQSLTDSEGLHMIPFCHFHQGDGGQSQEPVQEMSAGGPCLCSSLCY